ncbi:hypothetical protein HWV62_38268 [Athelia sp. TMB]|nr:hypothetical protein HWV62_12246 [Athelia sp. TMB]KAF7980431.1 hypothetical protein HWV62_38268 [Athelia sp. TMB]
MANAPTVCVIGAGAAGLITAHTLLQDGFDVTVLTRDPSPGGTWCKERLYPNILINNVHGEYRFSCMPMPAPPNSAETGARLTGEAMNGYMESFADRFLGNTVRYKTEVTRVRRGEAGQGWAITCTNRETQAVEVLKYDKLVLCTGGCSEPRIPAALNPKTAAAAAFKGPVLHSSQFRAQLPNLLALAKNTTTPGRVVVVGGGKSATDIAAYLTNHNLKVTMVFETADVFLASPMPLPVWIRKSRFLGVLSPDIELRTSIDRFLHTTRLGAFITLGFWSLLTWASLFTFKIPAKSPLRRHQPTFWTLRLNDEGVGHPRRNGFYDLVKQGKIELAAPTRAVGYGADGTSVLLSDGRALAADAVVLATGFGSSWAPIFDEATKADLGLGNHPPLPLSTNAEHEWDNYTTLASPPPSKANAGAWTSSLYRGIVPAKRVLARDLAFSTNNGLVFETAAHWISSYFLGDSFLRMPASAEEAFESTEREAAYLRRRHPDTLLWVNESYNGLVKFFTWPQFVDELLADMGLRTMRSGGNWLTWPFKVMDLQEIEGLHEERLEKRARAAQE